MAAEVVRRTQAPRERSVIVFRSAAQHASAISPCVRPLTYRAELLEDAGARGLLPLAFVGKAIDPRGRERKPPAVRHGIGPRDPLGRVIRITRAPALGVMRRGVHELGELAVADRALRDREDIHVDRARRIFEEGVARGYHDDVRLDGHARNVIAVAASRPNG